MLNVHSAGKEPYQSATPPRPLTWFQIVRLIIPVAIDVLKVVVLSLFELFKLPFKIWRRILPKDIKGQNALVTGGANGIGKAIALELAKCGCNVVIADVDEKASQKTLSLLKEFAVKSFTYTTDVSRPKDVEDLSIKVEESLGAVDILINNAGLMPLLSLREGNSADVQRIVDVNVNANFWTIRTFLPSMLARKRGHIVQISSMSALHPLPGATIYTATKYAVMGMMLALEEELRQEGHGICVDFTTVHPYFVATRMDLMNTLNLRFQAITPHQTAVETVRGILYRQRRVVIPHFDGLFTTILRNLPHPMQNLVRDHILRETQSRVIKDPSTYTP